MMQELMFPNNGVINYKMNVKILKPWFKQEKDRFL